MQPRAITRGWLAFNGGENSVKEGEKVEHSIRSLPRAVLHCRPTTIHVVQTVQSHVRLKLPAFPVLDPRVSAFIRGREQCIAPGTGSSEETASGFDQAEVAVITLVQHANAFGVSIAKHKELLWIGR